MVATLGVKITKGHWPGPQQYEYTLLSSPKFGLEKDNDFPTSPLERNSCCVGIYSLAWMVLYPEYGGC